MLPCEPLGSLRRGSWACKAGCASVAIAKAGRAERHILHSAIQMRRARGDTARASEAPQEQLLLGPRRQCEMRVQNLAAAPNAGKGYI